MNSTRKIGLAAAVVSAIAIACQSSPSSVGQAKSLLPIDFDTGRTYEMCGAMVVNNDPLLPIDFSTGRIYERCGATVAQNDPLLPIDFSTGRVYDTCAGIKDGSNCSCCAKR